MGWLRPFGLLPADDLHPTAPHSGPFASGGDGDPVRSAIEAIDGLQTEVARILRRTRASASVPPEQLEELTTQVAELRAAVAGWHRALDHAQVPPGPAPPASLDEPALLRALRGAPGGLAPRRIREVLRIDHTTSGTTLSRLLADALARGVVRRTGKGPGTRYHPGDGPPTA